MRQPGCRRSRRSPAAGAAAMVLTLSSARSSALQVPSSFVPPPRLRRLDSSLGEPRHDVAWVPSSSRHSLHLRGKFRLAPLAMSEDDDGVDSSHDRHGEEDGDDDEEDYNDIKSSLNKISWLPSVKLGRQPYKPKFGQISRKETVDGDGYEALESSGRTDSSPPGYQNIEILPVLPMTMVHGLDGMLVDNEEESLDGDISGYLGGVESYGASGVWDEGDPTQGLVSMGLGPLFSGTSGYLPHTKGHVFTVAEPRYKKLYDDLLRMGNYYGLKRDSALRRAKEVQGGNAEGGWVPDPASFPDPDEKRRFIVTAANPAEDGVFAEYGLLFQLKDLDEVAAVASYEMGGDGMTVEELRELMDDINAEYSEDSEDLTGILMSHYEATHDVVGRVKIHRFTNPECYSEGPDGEEYLMAEATILDVIDQDRVKMLKEKKSRASQEVEEVQPTTSLTAARLEEAKEQHVGEVAKAVSRIKEELRSSVSEAFKQQKQIDPEMIKDKLRSALDELPGLDATNYGSNQSNTRKGPIPMAPKGIMVEKRSDDSLNKEERALRESFNKLVALQHELKEECRFTRVSVQTFGLGPVGFWLSAAAWSQFVEKRLETTNTEMQSDIQGKLMDYLEEKADSESSSGYLGMSSLEGIEGLEGPETIDFSDLSPELQQEFNQVQNRAAEELGPLALERAIQIQRIVQAESYTDRLNVLRECVDNERRRLEAKKVLISLAFGSDEGDSDEGERYDMRVSREEARSIFERLMSSDIDKNDPLGGVFQ